MKNVDIIQRNVKESMQTQVENYILGNIEIGEWPVGSRIPSERDLSESLYVSRTTVRNAIQTLTDRGVFERKVGQGTFVSICPSEQIKSGTVKHVIGYTVCKEQKSRKPISAESFYFDMFSGITAACARKDYEMSFSYLDDYDSSEIKAFGVRLAGTDGMIIEELRNPVVLGMLRDSGVPVILLSPAMPAEGIDLISIDFASGVKKAIQHLYELGHRRIGMINGPLRFESALVRFNAWKSGMEQFGLDASDVYAAEGKNWSAEDGYKAAVELLKRNSGITAMLCANDLLAIGAVSALFEKGIKVPEQMSVIGFDDTELSRHSVPPLTTMKIYTEDIARGAVNRILEHVENGAIPPVRIEYPADLIIRKSTGEKKS